MSAPPEFLFDFGSPNAYLAHKAIPAIEARTGAKFAYVPVLLGGVFKATGNRSPGTRASSTNSRRKRRAPWRGACSAVQISSSARSSGSERVGSVRSRRRSWGDLLVQAASEHRCANLRERARNAAPSPKKPRPIIVHVRGSGAAAADPSKPPIDTYFATK